MPEANKKSDNSNIESLKSMPDKRGHFGPYGGGDLSLKH